MIILNSCGIFLLVSASGCVPITSHLFLMFSCFPIRFIARKLNNDLKTALLKRANHMITTFFTSAGLLVLNFVPKETKFNQDYFIHAVLPALYSEKTRIARPKGAPSFSVHVDNSMCHNGAKITEKPAKKQIVRPPHPSYSPDLSPCDFELFEMVKEKVKDRVFRIEQHILEAITQSWNELTFEDIQRVFRNWTERLIWIIVNSGEYYLS
jgi:hypothetical protein